MLHCRRPSRSYHLFSLQASPQPYCGRLCLLPHIRDLHGHSHLECKFALSPKDCAVLDIVIVIVRSTTVHANGDPQSQNAIWGFQIFLGTGLSLVLNSLVTTAQLSAPPEYM